MTPHESPPSPATAPLLGEAMSPWQMYFSLQGRIHRGDFWFFGVFVLVVLGAVLTALLRIAGVGTEKAEGAVNLLLAWPAIAVAVKRWHDRGRSGWWTLLYLVPALGQVWALLDNGCMPGDAGRNAHGEPPKAPAGLL